MIILRQRDPRLKRIRTRDYKKRAERVCHEFIRKRDPYCVTCGALTQTAGHYMHGKLDFDPINLNGQCTQCNHYKSGNLAVYAAYLERKYGQGTVEKLVLRANTDPNTFTRDQLIEIRAKYRQKIKDLELKYA